MAQIGAPLTAAEIEFYDGEIVKFFDDRERLCILKLDTETSPSERVYIWHEWVDAADFSHEECVGIGVNEFTQYAVAWLQHLGYTVTPPVTTERQA